MSFSIDDTAAVPAWQVRALDRSLADARARSVERLSQFVDAARLLATETGSPDFTVQQVVEGAGLSLKSFYRYFAGKDDLLLALLEEDSGIGAGMLMEYVEEQSDPVERLRAYVGGLFTFLAVGDRGYVSVLMREQRRLSELSPQKMRGALAPFLELLEAEMAAAAAAGVIRSGDFERDALMVFDVVLSMMHQVVFGQNALQPAEAGDYVWNFCWSGLGRTVAP
jgi:AcrR family transcriptional regulator